MSKIKKIKKIALWSALSSAVYFNVVSISTDYLYQHKDQDIEKYVQENIEQLILKQEQEIGINYPSERPKIEYTFPEKYIERGVIGLYNDQEDTLYLPSGLLTQPQWDFNDFVAKVATFNRTMNVKRVLNHELTHFYCDKLKERVWGKYYLFAHSYRFLSDEEIIADKIINEGIAEYIENKVDDEEKKPFNFQEWPLEVEEFSNHEIYQGGYAIVKPIIDKYKEKGIQFLLFNPPSEKELFTPQEYQQRVLADIAKLR